MMKAHLGMEEREIVIELGCGAEGKGKPCDYIIRCWQALIDSLGDTI